MNVIDMKIFNDTRFLFCVVLPGDMCEYSLITKDCNCPSEECPNHGKCCECVALHRKSKNKPPFCIRDIAWTDM